MKPRASAPRKFLTLPRARQNALIKASILVILVNSALRILPFAQLNRLLIRFGRGKHVNQDEQEIADLVWAVERAGAFFLGDKPCLTQALVAHWLLMRRDVPSRLQIGVRKRDEESLEAHAWLINDGRIIIGNLPDLTQFKALPDLERFLQ